MSSPANAAAMPRVAVVGMYAFLIVSALFFLAPFLVILINSVKPMADIRSGNLLTLPSEITFEPWRIAWSSACTGLDCSGIKPGLWNSILITVPAVVISVLTGALNGYALAQWRSRFADWLMLFILIGLFVPYQAMLYPTVKILSGMGIFRSYTKLYSAFL